MNFKYVLCVLILAFTSYSDVVSQILSSSEIIDCIVKDKKVRKYLKSEINQSWDRESPLIFIDTNMMCLTKQNVLAFHSFIKKKEKKIGISIDRLIHLHSDVCDSLVLNKAVIKKTAKLESKIWVVFSKEINNTLICHIYSNRNNNEVDKKDKIQQGVYITPIKIMLLLNDKKRILSKKVIPSGRLTSPVRFAD